MAHDRPVHGGNLTWAAAIAGCSPEAILDFSASINPLGPPATAIAAIQAQIAHLRHYPDPNYTHLCQTIATCHQLSPDWILPGNGVAELLTWVGRELSAFGETHLLTPAFRDYWRALKSFDVNVVPWPLDLLTLTLEGDRDLRQLLQKVPISREIAGGLLINNPHNPTGALFSKQQILGCLEHYGLVVVDEAFMDFLPPGEEQSVIDQVPHYPNLVVLRSLTKFYSLPGLRMGYAIAHPSILHRWQQWRDPWAVNTLAAAVAAAVMQDYAFQEQTWAWLPPTRQHLLQGLAALPGLLPYPSAANFLLVRSQVPVSALQEKLLQHHQILIRDCLSFPELGNDYFRVAIRTGAENQKLLSALRAIL